jgi:hypothetical protein
MLHLLHSPLIANGKKKKFAKCTRTNIPIRVFFDGHIYRQLLTAKTTLETELESLKTTALSSAGTIGHNASSSVDIDGFERRLCKQVKEEIRGFMESMESRITKSLEEVQSKTGIHQAVVLTRLP